MRFLGVVAVLAAFVATPASACLEIVTERSKAQAFKSADLVLKIEAQSEDYLPVPGTPSLRAGVGIGRVLMVLKGRASPGDAVAYRVVDGAGPDPSCPARRFTRPGEVYTLYLKHVSDWGPPIILLPVD